VYHGAGPTATVQSNMAFDRSRWVHGVWLRATAAVEDRALDEAARRISRLLGRCPAVVANLGAASAELHIVGRNEPITSLPQYQHLKGVPVIDGQTLDARGRGYGGLHACCSEEMLLRLPSARHVDHRDILAHELAHTVLDFGVDERYRARVRNRWRTALAEGRWIGAYAATNPHEFFAELTMWWVGSRGDHGTLARAPADGRAGLLAYDARSHDVLDDLWSGRTAPTAQSWDELSPRPATRSGAGTTPTTLVFVNPTEAPAERWWLDREGREVAYGPVPAGGVLAQSTYTSHAWVVTHPVLGRLGPWVASRAPARVLLAPALSAPKTRSS